MPPKAPEPATLTTIASFPRKYFLENLVMREDSSILVTVTNQNELWYVPPVNGMARVEPSLMLKFKEPLTAIVEGEPDVFYIGSGNLYTTHEAYLWRLDLRKWSPGERATPELVFQFPSSARGLNGSCLLGARTILIADCFASLIWRVDFPSNGDKPTPRVWFKHESMGYFPGALKPEQPGVNGIRTAWQTNHVYYTATAKKLLMRVLVDPQTLKAASDPELVVAGRMGDDFCIDETAGFLYLTTHRQNTIDRVSLNPANNSGFTETIAGVPFTEQLIGPSSIIWGRAAGEVGRVAYAIADGGTASPPPDGMARPATLLRVEL